MQRLEDIGVRVESGAYDIRLGNALPLLHEIAGRLAALIEHGTRHTIDLQALPLAPGDREFLLEALGEGEGEIEATLDALGPSHVRETAVQGVWWITHYNSHDQMMAELIEITDMPRILLSQHADMEAGLQRLRERLGQLGGST